MTDVIVAQTEALKLDGPVKASASSEQGGDDNWKPRTRVARPYVF